MAKEETGLHKNLILTMFHSPLSVYARRAISEYTNYFSANFLVGYTARPYRYITPGVGLLTFVEAFLFVLGCISIFKDRKSTLPLALLLVSPLPAAVTTEDSPNLHRAFFMIIFITIIEAYGILLITKNLHYAKQLLTIIFAFWLINFVFFLHMYYLHSNIHRPLLLNVNMDASSFRNIGAKDLSYKLEEVKKVYEKIIITNFPDDPYPWYAFFTGKDPQNFNKYAVLRKQGSWSYQNIIFSQSKCPSDSYFKSEKENNILVVDAGDCLDEVKIKDGRPMKIVDSIVRSDNSPVYVLLERN